MITPGRALVAAVGLAVGAAAVLAMREATLSTHQPVPPDSRVTVIVDVDTRHRERGQSQAELVETLFAFCRLEVSSDVVRGPREIAPDRYQVVLQPAFDETNRRQFRGCVEDWTLDGIQAHVRSLVDQPPP